MKRIYLILVIFIATSASFSQYQYIEKTDDTLLNYERFFYSMTKDEREAIRVFSNSDYEEQETIKKILENYDDSEKETIKNFFKNESRYYSARRKFILGVSMGGESVLLGLIALISDPTVAGILYGTQFVVSIPFTIVGAVNMHKYKKYKPTVSVSPNEVKFSINF